MPAWHHLGLAPKHYRKRRNKCLLENHDLSHVVDMVKLARRTENPDCDVRRHHPIKTCVCNSCKEDRRRGCANPNKCSRTAHEILQGLHPKFDPKINPPDDNLTLTHRRREKNNTNRSQKKRGDPVRPLSHPMHRISGWLPNIHKPRKTIQRTSTQTNEYPTRNSIGRRNNSGLHGWLLHEQRQSQCPERSWHMDI